MPRAAPSLSVRIDFSAGRLGPGKVALLEAIGRLRSLAAAARELDMSYKRAWNLLTVLNTMFDHPVAMAHPGRNRDGSTDLTPFGARVVALYRAVEQRAERAARAALAELGAAARREVVDTPRVRRSLPRAAAQPTRRASAQPARRARRPAA